MTQLDVLANELHEQAIADFKVSERFAYSFIMKVKRIRDERLYKELGFSSFDEYCERAWNTVRRSMDERIQIADGFGQRDFESTYSQLGHSKSLLLIRMEPEIRQQVESQIDVSEATVKQLKEVERRAQEAERAAQLAKQEAERMQNQAHHFEKLWNSEKNKPAQTITKTVETAPRDYNEAKVKAARLELVQGELESVKKQLELYKNDAAEYKELKKKIEFLHHEKNDLHRQIESATALSGLSVEIDNFLKTKLAPIRYSRALERLDSDVAVRNLTEIIETVEHWCEDMRRYLPQNNRKVVIDYDPAG